MSGSTGIQSGQTSSISRIVGVPTGQISNICRPIWQISTPPHTPSALPGRPIRRHGEQETFRLQNNTCNMGCQLQIHGSTTQFYSCEPPPAAAAAGSCRACRLPSSSVVAVGSRVAGPSRGMGGTSILVRGRRQGLRQGELQLLLELRYPSDNRLQ